MNTLILYNSSQTYTNTVFDHLSSFAKYSHHRAFYSNTHQKENWDININNFDIVIVHYSIRLPYDQITSVVKEKLHIFKGLKCLFIQDEQDYSKKSWSLINELDIDLVFTAAPKTKSIEYLYPKKKFPKTRFVPVLTGYIADDKLYNSFPPPSKRIIKFGYRGRHLTLRHGELGFDKINIGKKMKSYCDENKIICDIAWEVEDRIYGVEWINFLGSCKSMLGTESGCNVIDWNGDLSKSVKLFQLSNPKSTLQETYRKVIRPHEVDGLMNMVSPKIFEAICMRAVLVLFEGEYSSVLTPGEDFIVLKRDLSNVNEVISLLDNGPFIDLMTKKVWNKIVGRVRNIRIKHL